MERILSSRKIAPIAVVAADIDYYYNSRLSSLLNIISALRKCTLHLQKNKTEDGINGRRRRSRRRRTKKRQMIFIVIARRTIAHCRDMFVRNARTHTSHSRMWETRGHLFLSSFWHRPKNRMGCSYRPRLSLNVLTWTCYNGHSNRIHCMHSTISFSTWHSNRSTKGNWIDYRPATTIAEWFYSKLIRNYDLRCRSV